MTPMSVILMSLLLTLNIFHTFSSVSTVNIEQVNAGWESLPYVTWMITIFDF